jgi:hypothetical protein
MDSSPATLKFPCKIPLTICIFYKIVANRHLVPTPHIPPPARHPLVASPESLFPSAQFLLFGPT